MRALALSCYVRARYDMVSIVKNDSLETLK